MGSIKIFTLVVFYILPTISYSQGRAAVPISLEDTNGQNRIIHSYRDSLTIVHFWATWCSPCLKELPQLVKVASTLKDQGLSVIFIAADNLDDTRNYLHKEKLNMEVLIDQYGKTMRDYQIQALPSSVFINAEGLILKTKTGQIDWQNKVILNRLLTRLKR